MRAMMSEPFRVTAESKAERDLRIITARGAITYTSSPLLMDAVMAASERRLIIDMREVPSVDSMAVGALVRAYVHCQKSGKGLALVGLTQRVRNVLQLTCIDPLFDTYSSLAEAEAELAKYS